MNMVPVDNHHTHRVILFCSNCGGRCIAPNMSEFKYAINRGIGPIQQRAYADLDAPAGTFYCRDCANDKQPSHVSRIGASQS